MTNRRGAEGAALATPATQRVQKTEKNKRRGRRERGGRAEKRKAESFRKKEVAAIAPEKLLRKTTFSRLAVQRNQP